MKTDQNYVSNVEAQLFKSVQSWLYKNNKIIEVNQQIVRATYWLGYYWIV